LQLCKLHGKKVKAHPVFDGKQMVKQTVTLENIRQQVLERKKRLSDEVVSTKSLLMDPAMPGKMIVRRPGSGKEDSYDFDKRIYQQASGVVYGMPGAYLEKLIESDKGDPGLAALNFNHWIGVCPEKEALLRFRTDDEGNRILRAIRPSSWNPIPYESSIETLITKFGPDKSIVVERFDEDRLVLNIVTRRIEPNRLVPGTHNRIVGDDFEWGVRFSDSDVGRGDATISPYSLRLVCSNGATTMTKGVIISISHSGKASSILDQAMSNLRQGVEMVDGFSVHVVQQIEASSKYLIDVNADTGEPDSALARLSRDMAVTRLEDKYIREGWKQEGETLPENTLYRLANAVTRAGSHAEELNPESKLKLQAIGGRILETSLLQNYKWN
jgi:hypothetical protein